MEPTNNIPQSVKTPMTDEERKKLAEQLDQELDEFIGGLEKRSYTEGWPEDRWQEEMEKHPFFMTKPPKEGEVLSPLMEGLQQLKYSESDNTPEELAATYKDDGNFNFKIKKYRIAIISYTEGLKLKCGDVNLNSELYNNRAAAHFYLKNYRSCLADCKAALKLRPNYTKCKSRAAQCCLYLQRYDECTAFCDEILSSSPTDKAILELRAKAAQGKKSEERNARKESAVRKKEEERDQLLLKAIKERGIHLEGNELSMSALESCSPLVAHSRVHFDENGLLVWPVMFLYPEYQITDLVQEFHEDTTFLEHLEKMFESPPEWDKEHIYVPDKLSIYYEDKSCDKLIAVSPSEKLRNVLSRKRYLNACGGSLLVLKNADTSRPFLKMHGGMGIPGHSSWLKWCNQIYPLQNST